MKNNFSKALGAFVLTGVLASSATAQLNETFDDRSGIASIVTDAGTNNFFSDGGTDYFGILDQVGATDDFGAGTAPSGESLLNTNGNFLVAQDTDGDTTDDICTLTWSVNISGMADPHFAVSLAEGDDGSNQDWDGGSSVRFSVTVDANPSQNLVHVENQTGGTNAAPAIDTNFDGEGDGTEITNTFAQFTADITGTGTTAVITLVIENLVNGDEDIAIDDIIVQDGPFVVGATDPVIGEAYSISDTEIVLDFAVSATSGGESTPGNYSLNDASGAVVTSVSGANPFTLTLDTALSGDLTADTLTFDNSAELAASIDVFAGIVSVSDIRAAVLADTVNVNPSFGLAQATVTAELLENVLDSFGNDDAFLDGIQITDNNNIDTLTTVGANVTFAGTIGSDNGVTRLNAGGGIISVDSDTVLDATPIALGDATALTTATLELNEGKFVTITNVEFDDAGTSIVIGGAGIDAGINNPDFVIRFDRDVEDEFELLELQSGRGVGIYPSGPGVVTGIVGQFVTSDPRNSGYQVFPLLSTDLNYPAFSSVNDWMTLNQD